MYCMIGVDLALFPQFASDVEFAQNLLVQVCATSLRFGVVFVSHSVCFEATSICSSWKLLFDAVLLPCGVVCSSCKNARSCYSYR